MVLAIGDVVGETLSWKLLSPEKMVVTRRAAHFCRLFHPGGSTGYADSLVFSADRGKRVSHTKSQAACTVLYRRAQLLPITSLKRI